MGPPSIARRSERRMASHDPRARCWVGSGPGRNPGVPATRRFDSSRAHHFDSAALRVAPLSAGIHPSYRAQGKRASRQLGVLDSRRASRRCPTNLRSSSSGVPEPRSAGHARVVQQQIASPTWTRRRCDPCREHHPPLITALRTCWSYGWQPALRDGKHDRAISNSSIPPRLPRTTSSAAVS